MSEEQFQKFLVVFKNSYCVAKFGWLGLFIYLFQLLVGYYFNLKVLVNCMFFKTFPKLMEIWNLPLETASESIFA